jgi:hypothetical protein
VRVAAHGRSIDVPTGWDARIFRRSGSAPVLHVATFALREQDGDFGAAATGRMRADDVFAALVEYREDAKLRRGHGLFAEAGHPASLRARDFWPTQLQVARPGQLGAQRFFTDAGRPCCLYAVIQPLRRRPAQLVNQLTRVLATLGFTAEPAPDASSKR